MQKNAWIYTIAASVLGALGLLFRWLQLQSVFDETTGLPAEGAGLSTLVVLMIIVTAGALWWLAGRLSPDMELEPEAAFASPTRLTGLLMTAAGALAALGSAAMFFTEDALFMRILALVGFASAAVLALYPSVSRWGGFGAAMTVLPVLFFAGWLVAFYKDNSTNPVVWEYGVRILAISACLLGAFRLSGCVFYRTKPRQGVFACGLGMCLSLMVLMDNASAGARVVFFGWALGFGTMAWMLLRNYYIQGPMPPDKTPAKSGEEHPDGKEKEQK